MNDEEFRQGRATLEAYKMQLDALTRQSQILQMSYDETIRARDTLKAIDAAKEGDDLLIPIGGSSFISVKVSANRNAIVGIGGKVSIEKDVAEAAEYMAKNVDEITEALKKSADTMEEMERRAIDLANVLQQEAVKRQQQLK